MEGADNAGGYGVAVLVITDGRIAACNFSTFDLDGTERKGEDYGKVNGTIEDQDTYNKAQRAIAANEIYAKELVETGKLDDVDLVSGATISYYEFQEAVNEALDQARE